MVLPFIKSQGCGNDFVIIDERARLLVKEEYRGHLARNLCDRNFWVGATSVLYMLPPESGQADVFMRIFEADKSESKMCGNGVRCIADCYSEGRGPGIIRVQTQAGIKEVEKIVAGTKKEYAVNMGYLAATQNEINRSLSDKVVCLDGLGIVGRLEGIPFEIVSEELAHYGRFHLYGTGEPHLVVFVEGDVYGEDNTRMLHKIGAAFNLKDSWLRKPREYGGKGVTPFGCNVNIVQTIKPDEISIRTYERGVDNETLACGTGATACAAAAYLSQRVDSQRIRVNVKGNNALTSLTEERCPDYLTIELARNDDNGLSLKLTGPAETVARGEIMGSAFRGIERFLIGG